MSSTWDEGYAEEQREANDRWFGEPGWVDPPERDDEDGDDG